MTHDPKTPELDDAAIRGVEPVLLAFAIRSVRSRSLAQDLVQETYVAALESRASFQGRSSLRTWMVGILMRKIVDHYRKHRREVLVDQLPETGAPTRSEPPGSPPPPSPERVLDDKTALRIIEQTLPKLSELERMAVLACDVEQLERDEACNALGVQPTHLRVLLHRARHKLRDALEHAELPKR